MEEEYIFDYSKLRGRIREKFNNECLFAKEMGLSQATMSNKLNNGSEWTDREIEKAIRLLGLTIKDIDQYFFEKKLE